MDHGAFEQVATRLANFIAWSAPPERLYDQADDAARAEAERVIIEEMEHLRWCVWNGKVKGGQISIEHIRAIIHAFQGEPDGRRSAAPSRKFWTALAKRLSLWPERLAGQLRRASSRRET